MSETPVCRTGRLKSEGNTYPELKASDYPLVLMTWGESLHYIPLSNR